MCRTTKSTDSSSSDSSDDNYYYDNDNNSDSGSTEDDGTSEREKRPRATKNTSSGSEADEKSEITVSAVKWNGPAGYTVIYPKGNAEMKAAAEKIRSYFSEKAGQKLTVSDDSAAVGAKEILIGNTNRRKSELKENKYAVSIKNNKIYIEGGHTAMTETAAEWFVSLNYESGKLNTLNGECESFKSKIKKRLQICLGRCVRRKCP